MRYILVVELFQQQIVVDRIKRLLKVNQQSPNSPTLVKHLEQNETKTRAATCQICLIYLVVSS